MNDDPSPAVWALLALVISFGVVVELLRGIKTVRTSPFLALKLFQIVGQLDVSVQTIRCCTIYFTGFASEIDKFCVKWPI